MDIPRPPAPLTRTYTNSGFGVPKIHLSTWTDRTGIRRWRAHQGDSIDDAFPETTDLEVALRDYEPVARAALYIATLDWRTRVVVWHADLGGWETLGTLEHPSPTMAYAAAHDVGESRRWIPQTNILDPFCWCGDLLARCPRQSRDCTELP